jgi:hypothetical protein
MAHWPCFFGSGHLPNGLTRPVSIVTLVAELEEEEDLPDVVGLGEEADLVAGLEEEAGEDVAVVHQARARLFVLLEHRLQGPVVQVGGGGGGWPGGGKRP